jgi:RHS repeat-associated protein
MPMGFAAGSNKLCGITIATCSTGAGSGTGLVSYDASGNITRYTRPTAAQAPNVPGADGATLDLLNYTAFNLPLHITKSVGGSVQASGEFFYDAGYQRVRQVKRSGPIGTGATNFVDDILYVVPGGFEVHRNAAGQVTSSIATISGPDGTVATVTTHFDVSTGLPMIGAGLTAQTASISGLNTVTKLVLKDHLGSMTAEAMITGSVDATGKLIVGSVSVIANGVVVHGFGPWGNARNATSPLAEGQRGFTGHEMLDELGFIHMNGRLYDPITGRFLQADPIIQSAYDGQNYNRYSYVMNNPLSYTDPTGFSWWTKWRKTVFAVVAAIAVPWAVGELFLGAVGVGETSAFAIGSIGSEAAVLTTAGKAVAAMAGGFAAGGISGGNIQSALQGAFTAALTFGVGELSGAHAASAAGRAMTAGERALQVGGHALVGCASGAAAGGSCKAGAMSAGFSALAGPHLPGGDSPNFHAGNLLARMAVGAIASKVGGGKAENGALSAAFEYLFNQLAYKSERGCLFFCTTTTEGFRRGGSIQDSIDAGALFRDVTAPAITGAYGAAAATEWVGLGGLTMIEANSSSALTVTSAKRFWDNLFFDGPSPGLLHANGRIFGMRWKGGQWGVRLDLHPLNYDPTPVLHLNIGSLAKGESAHVPIFDPKWLGLGKSK